MAGGSTTAILSLLIILFTIEISFSQVLTPPYFNLAYGRPIVATSTCGEGVSEPELFCKLTGANPEHEAVQPHFSVIQGQLCDVCDPRSGEQQAHPANQAVDGTERWWQSPPLSRGPQFNQVNLTIDLQQVCSAEATPFCMKSLLLDSDTKNVLFKSPRIFKKKYNKTIAFKWSKIILE